MSTTIEGIASKRLSARDQVRRDDEIVKSRMRGVTWSTIASRHGLTERRCQQIMSSYRETHQTPRHRNPLELLDELLEGYTVAREDLAEIAATTAHDATRVGAIRSSMAAMEAQAELLTAVGVMPALQSMRVEINARELVRKLVAVLDQFDAPVEMRFAMYETLGGNDASVLDAMGVDRETSAR